MEDEDGIVVSSGFKLCFVEEGSDVLRVCVRDSEDLYLYSSHKSESFKGTSGLLNAVFGAGSPMRMTSRHVLLKRYSKAEQRLRHRKFSSSWGILTRYIGLWDMCC